MAVAELLKNVTVDVPIPIFINNKTDIFLFNSYVRGYHAYMDVCNAIINDSVHYKNEEDSEFDTTAFAFIRNDCLKQNVVGHVPIHLSRTFYRFLKLPVCSISATVASKGVNRDAGDGPEIPVECRLFGDKSAVT